MTTYVMLLVDRWGRPIHVVTDNPERMRELIIEHRHDTEDEKTARKRANAATIYEVVAR